MCRRRRAKGDRKLDRVGCSRIVSFRTTSESVATCDAKESKEMREAVDTALWRPSKLAIPVGDLKQGSPLAASDEEDT